jgi:hypothetical protein
MIINFYLKEESSIKEDYVTISVVRKSEDRIQSTNAKGISDLTAIEQQNIKHIIATLEKYSSEDTGASQLTYGL